MTPFYNLTVCESLASEGHDVTYIASPYLYTPLSYPANVHAEMLYFRELNALGKTWLQKVPKVRQLLRGMSYPFGNLALLARARRQRPDVVHFQWSRLPVFDLPTVRQLQRQGIPVVHTVHDIVPLFEKGDIPRLYDIYRTCDALVVHSEHNKQELLARVVGIDPQRVHVVPLIHAPFVADSAMPNLVRARHHLPEDAFIILFLGSIKPYKGLSLLVDTIRQVNAQTNAVHWLIVGKADDADQQALMSKASQEARVVVVQAYVSNEEVAHYHQASDVAIFPYQHIFQSAALITAMGFGLPVIATAVGSFPETLDGNGWLVPKQNANALTQAILESVSQPQLREQMGRRSLELIQTRHSPQAVAARLLALYASLVRNVS
jgi:glycosyltransferase involved in cell wall biosynthesis